MKATASQATWGKNKNTSVNIVVPMANEQSKTKQKYSLARAFALWKSICESKTFLALFLLSSVPKWQEYQVKAALTF